MTEPLPEPLTPAACDLTDYRRMPLHVGRLLGSSTWIDAALRPRVGHALMTLWAESWRQVPCGSLPDSDVQLFRMSMCPELKEWRGIREEVRSSFTLCSNGRLYHPVVAEMALECWLDKLHVRRRSALGNASKHGNEPAVEAIDLAIEEAVRLLTALNPLNDALRKRRPGGKDAPPPPGGRKGSRMSPSGSPNGSEQGFPVRSQVKERKVISPQSPPHGLCGQLGLSDRDGLAFACEADGWPSTRPGVEALGVHAGLGRWDEQASQLGHGEPFGLYEQRVRAAFEQPALAVQRSGSGAAHVAQVLKVVG